MEEIGGERLCAPRNVKILPPIDCVSSVQKEFDAIDLPDWRFGWPKGNK